MYLFKSRSYFDKATGAAKKWARSQEALTKAPGLLQNVAYSVGDSVTYWWDSATSLSSADFIGHRRYFTVLASMDFDFTVEIAQKSRLSVSCRYDDLSDRELFHGSGDKITVEGGQILVCDIDEAVRIIPGSQAHVNVLHVTIEDL